MRPCLDCASSGAKLLCAHFDLVATLWRSMDHLVMAYLDNVSSWPSHRTTLYDLVVTSWRPANHSDVVYYNISHSSRWKIGIYRITIWSGATVWRPMDYPIMSVCFKLYICVIPSSFGAVLSPQLWDTYEGILWSVWEPSRPRLSIVRVCFCVHSMFLAWFSSRCY